MTADIRTLSRSLYTIKLELEVTPRELDLILDSLMAMRDRELESAHGNPTGWTVSTLEDFIGLLGCEDGSVYDERHASEGESK